MRKDNNKKRATVPPPATANTTRMGEDVTKRERLQQPQASSVTDSDVPDQDSEGLWAEPRPPSDS